MKVENTILSVALAAALATTAAPAPAVAAAGGGEGDGERDAQVDDSPATATASGEALAAQDGDVASARAALSGAQASLEAAGAAYGQAQKDLEQARARQAAAEDESKGAEKDLACAQASLGEAKAENASARASLSDAQARLDFANSPEAARKVSDAQAASDSAAQAASAAKETCIAASKAADEARSALSDGAFAFFGAVGAQYCVDEILEAQSRTNHYTTTTYENKTARGSDEDATSTANMLASVKFMRECNELRASEGLPALMVTLPNMAIAMWRVNWSYTGRDHACAWNVGENLSWGAGRAFDPYRGWYTLEKADYEAGNGGVTGHYTAIVDDDTETLGYAIHAAGDYGKGCHSLVFNDHSLRCYRDAPQMTVDEYEALLTGWVDEQNEAVAAGEAAEASLAAAEKDASDAQDRLAAAKDAADAGKAKAALDEAEGNADAAAAKLAAAQAEKDSAQAARDAAQAECKDAAQAAAAIDIDGKTKDVEDAQAACDAAQAALEAAYAPYAFADVDYSLYYGPTVAKAAKDGLMTGYSGTADFGPEDVMTRGQLATVLWRAACPDAAAAYDEATASNETGMADVEGGKYYTAAANWAARCGVINGFDIDGHREFRPYEAVTMEQLACIMANLTAGGAEGYDASGLAARYADASNISNWALAPVAYGTDQGWFAGYEAAGGARELRPGEALCRGRAATMLVNMGLGA